MIYLASPYSDPDPAIQEERFRAVYDYVHLSFRKAVVVFSPIVYCHQYHASGQLPGDFAFWQTFNEDMLLRSDELHVLTLKGWDASVGVNAEIVFAHQHNITVRYVV